MPRSSTNSVINGGGTSRSSAGLSVLVNSNYSGWTLHNYQTLDSTNLAAAGLPPWNAVRSIVQTAGRGRYQRSWVSDEGGLWLSAVVPVANAESARVLPLIAGLALCSAFESLELKTVRMRWPNDLLAGDRKLAGILVDTFQPSAAVIGIGVNIHNRPDNFEPALRNQTSRLADLLPCPITLDEVTSLVLRCVRNEMEAYASSGFTLPIERVNKVWGSPRVVELDLDGELRRGTFTGVDLQGRLGLWGGDGALEFYSAHQVRHLTELETET